MPDHQTAIALAARLDECAAALVAAVLRVAHEDARWSDDARAFVADLQRHVNERRHEREETPSHA